MTRAWNRRSWRGRNSGAHFNDPDKARDYVEFLRAEGSEVEGGGETLARMSEMQMHEGTAINRAMLTLVPRAVEMAGGDRHRRPTLDDPAWIIGIGCVLWAGHFATNGPIEHGD